MTASYLWLVMSTKPQYGDPEDVYTGLCLITEN